MSLSESEHHALLELWGELPPVRRRTLARYALTRRARVVWAWLRNSWIVLGLLAYAAGMIVLAGALFHNGYAAGAAGTVAAGAGFLAGIAWSARRQPHRR